MPELIIGVISVVVIAFITWIYMSNKQHKNTKTNVIHILEKYGKVSFDQHKIYFKKDTKTYEILFYRVARTHELTINSKYIWEVHMKGRSVLINQINFLKSDYSKLIIIYPLETKIKRYINENEMEFVNYRDEFYNMRLIKEHELELLLSEVII